MSSFNLSFSEHAGEELRKSVLIRNALKAATSSSSLSQLAKSWNRGATFSQPSQSQERWTLMASRSGLSQSNLAAEHVHDQATDEVREAEHCENETHICSSSSDEGCDEQIIGQASHEWPRQIICCVEDHEEEEGEWFAGLLAEVSAEQFLGDEDEQEVVASWTISLPSLIVDIEDDSSADEDDGEEEEEKMNDNNTEDDSQRIAKSVSIVNDSHQTSLLSANSLST